MARKKLARNQDLEGTIRTSIRHLVKILLSEDGLSALSRWIAFHEQQAAYLTTWLNWLTTTPRSELDIHFDEIHHRLTPGKLSHSGILEEDLAGVAAVLEGITSVLSTGVPPASDQMAARTWFKHLLNQSDFKPRRFKPQFEEAFLLRYKADQNGKLVTIVTLTQRLTPYEYKGNPESALRSMERGIKRVRAEHERCVALGVPSPFLPVSTNLETKKRHK